MKEVTQRAMRFDEYRIRSFDAQLRREDENN